MKKLLFLLLLCMAVLLCSCSVKSNDMKTYYMIYEFQGTIFRDTLSSNKVEASVFTPGKIHFYVEDTIKAIYRLKGNYIILEQ